MCIESITVKTDFKVSRQAFVSIFIGSPFNNVAPNGTNRVTVRVSFRNSCILGMQ